VGLSIGPGTVSIHISRRAILTTLAVLLAIVVLSQILVTYGERLEVEVVNTGFDTHSGSWYIILHARNTGWWSIRITDIQVLENNRAKEGVTWYTAPHEIAPGSTISKLIGESPSIVEPDKDVFILVSFPSNGVTSRTLVEVVVKTALGREFAKQVELELTTYLG